MRVCVCVWRNEVCSQHQKPNSRPLVNRNRNMEAFPGDSSLQRQHKQFLQAFSAEINAAWMGNSFAS